MKADLRWVDKDNLAIEVGPNGMVVIIHQRDHISRDKWNTLIMSPDDLRALVKALEE